MGSVRSLAPGAVDANELLDKVERHLQRLLGRSRRLVRAQRKAVLLLTNALVDQRLLSGEQGDALLEPLLDCGSARANDLTEVNLPVDPDLVGDEDGDTKLA